MIDVKQATTNALNYLVELPLTGLEDKSAIRLEEVELTDDDRFWLVTLSLPDRTGVGLQDFLSQSGPPRQYKAFKIDAETGDIRSMKIRQLEGV